MTMTRQRASALVADLGWRFLLGTYRTCVPVASLAEAGAVAAQVLSVPGVEGHLRLDLRDDRVILTVFPPGATMVAEAEADLARRISDLVVGLGLKFEPESTQMLELAIDAIDISEIRPFWRAVLGYADEVLPAGPNDPIIDPAGQGPAIWFQQMDAPRPQRNRIHFDLAVPHDQLEARLAAALVAGGALVSDRDAPAFWVLADPEGNEICLTTWQGRD
ncbi:MAG TPA: VOC family protein [Candidatus Limnocylindrales bacterium]|nr:VOC family protein [Candidatus Limnocylindrales bacterium]